MVINSVHHTYKHIHCRQSSECSLSKKQSSDPLLDHTQEGFIFMETISFQGSLLYFRQNLLVLLFASPSHVCFLYVLSPSCHRYFGTFSQSHLPRPRLLDFFLLNLLLFVNCCTQQGDTNSGSNSRLARSVPDKAAGPRNKLVGSPRKLSCCSLPSDCRHEEPLRTGR